MNIALILSGGTGTRLGGDIPKQYIEAGGHLIISYCIACLSMHEGIDRIQIVAEPVWQERILACLDEERARERFKGKFSGFSLPGQTRQLSILSGLEDIIEYADEEDCVLIHDAARPLLTETLISDCLDAIDGHDGVLPTLPMKDTVYLSKDGERISALLDRKEILPDRHRNYSELALIWMRIANCCRIGYWKSTVLRNPLFCREWIL